MVQQLLWVTGSAVFLILGSLHLYYTFFSNKFLSRNEKVMEEMKNSHPILTRGTTMWKAWIGFNASHSLGIMFIGAINIILATEYYSIMKNSVTIMGLTIVVAIVFLWLAKKYWFRIPFRGVVISLICFITSFILSFT
jgi:hypothetical protein